MNCVSITAWRIPGHQERTIIRNSQPGGPGLLHCRTKHGLRPSDTEAVTESPCSSKVPKLFTAYMSVQTEAKPPTQTGAPGLQSPPPGCFPSSRPCLEVGSWDLIFLVPRTMSLVSTPAPIIIYLISKIKQSCNGILSSLKRQENQIPATA